MEWFDDITKRVHSPRGKMADKEVVYQELCQQLGIEREVEIITRQSLFGRRIAAAACIVLVVAIGVAGIYQYHVQLTSNETSTIIDTQSPEKLSPLVFDNQPLGQIVSVLSERFDIEVTVQDTTLAQYRMTATFAADETLPEILSVLATAGHFHFCKTECGYSLIP